MDAAGPQLAHLNRAPRTTAARHGDAGFWQAIFEVPTASSKVRHSVPTFETLQPDKMPTIKFVNEQKEIEVPDGANLRRAAMKAGVPVYDGLNGFGAKVNSLINCHGLGMCGTCRMLVTKGMENTNPLTVREKLKLKLPIPTPDPIPCLAYIGHEDTMCLSCMTQVHGDIEVETTPKLDLFGENFFS